MGILTTKEALEYIREQTGRTNTPHKSSLNRWQQLGRITPHTRGGNKYADANTYLLADVQLLCERINDGYWRKAGQSKREYKQS